MKYKIIADYHNMFNFLYKITVMSGLIYGLINFFASMWEVYDFGAIGPSATLGSRFLILFVLPISLIISAIISIKLKSLKSFTIVMLLFILSFTILIGFIGHPSGWSENFIFF